MKSVGEKMVPAREHCQGSASSRESRVSVRAKMKGIFQPSLRFWEILLMIACESKKCSGSISGEGRRSGNIRV